MKVNLPPRRLIPQWRRTKSVLGMPEATFGLSGTARELTLDRSQLHDATEMWKRHPTVGFLGDVLSFCIDRSLRPEVVQLIREHPHALSEATVAQAEFIRRLLDDGDNPQRSTESEKSLNKSDVYSSALQQEVATIRRILRVNPADPLALLDLAQFQLSSGNFERAEKSIRSALSLSPSNRLALRTTARFYVHRLDFGKAHALIDRHPRTAVDPWLMASEIALADAADVPSRFASKGFKFVRDKMAPVAHLSELAGALGHAELQAGNVKRARDMFRLALREPNDNVAAQVVTVQQQLGIDRSTAFQGELKRGAREAKTILAWNDLDFSGAELHALAWHDEEPFSSRPLNFLTSLYAGQGDYPRATALAKRGLIADPKDVSLLANLAYTLACQGQQAEAGQILVKLAAHEERKYLGIATATAGLMMMLQQAFEDGCSLYESAMRLFREEQAFDLEALCCAYFARSAVDSGFPEQDTVIRRAEDLYKRHSSPDVAVVLKSLDRDVTLPIRDREVQRMNRWMFDPATESLIQVGRISSPDTPPLVIRR